MSVIIREGQEVIDLAHNHQQINHHTEPGYVSFIANVTTARRRDSNYVPGHFKYVVVVGTATSTSGMFQLTTDSSLSTYIQTTNTTHSYLSTRDNTFY